MKNIAFNFVCAWADRKQVVVVWTALCGLAALAAVGPKDYVQDGLVALYDAEFNSVNAQGVAVHDAAATTWANLASGVGDIALPESGVTIDAKTVTLSKLTATAPNCTVYDFKTPLTLESCARSVSTSTTYSYDLPFVQIPSRAGMGWDARNNQSFVVIFPNSTDFTQSKKRYHWFVKSTFAAYAPVQRSYSAVVPANANPSCYTNGVSVGTKVVDFVAKVASAPTDSLIVGNANIETAINVVRVYGRELTDDERLLNAAIDAVRFRGADPQSVTLPTGYSFDADGNLVTPWSGTEHRITASGTTTFEAPYAEAKTLVNASVNGPVTFDETAYAADEAHKLSFLGFDAFSWTKTKFLGGWWDFNGGGVLATSAVRRINRQLCFNGSTVTNGGDLCLCGTLGSGNRLYLENAADVTVGKCLLSQSSAAKQNSEIWITGGSRLTCTNYLSFCESKEKSSALLTGNKVVVSNENSQLVVQGATYMDRDQGNYAGGVGGNHLIVTDKARVTLQALNIANVGAHSRSNRVTVSKGGLLTMTSLNLGTPWYSGGNPDHTLFEVLDGGVVTNTGTLSWGYIEGKIWEHYSSTLVVSNSTFINKKAVADGRPFIRVGKSTVLLSGPKTKFRFCDSYNWNTPLFGQVVGGNRVILENFVTNNLPLAFGFSYTGTSTNNEVIVRTGACLDQGESDLYSRVMMAGYNGNILGYRNKVLVESGASVKCTQFYANSVDGFVGVSNATITCTTPWYYGEHLGFTLGGKTAANNPLNDYGRGTNMVLALSGTTPRIRLTNSRMGIDSASTIRFDLPPEGYAEPETPIIKVDATGGGTTMLFRDTSGIAFTGAEELAQYHTDVLKHKGRYLLIDAAGILNIDDVMARAQATLPEGMKLVKQTAGSRLQIWLEVRPQSGLLLIFR